MTTVPSQTTDAGPGPLHRPNWRVDADDAVENIREALTVRRPMADVELKLRREALLRAQADIERALEVLG